MQENQKCLNLQATLKNSRFSDKCLKSGISGDFTFIHQQISPVYSDYIKFSAVHSDHLLRVLV